MNNPTLYGKTSKGQIKVWTIRVDRIGDPVRGDYAVISTVHGLIDGKQQIARVTIREGKNIGKANETTPLEQATAEALAKWKKQIDKGYRESEEELDAVVEAPRAMLAHRYDKRGKSMKWPAYVQPKLDGIRLIAHVTEHGVYFYSRNGKDITTVDHLQPALMETFPVGTVLDGELFNPEMPLQDIVSGAKKLSDKSRKLQYWIYDVIEDGPYSDRLKHLREWYSVTYLSDVVGYIFGDEEPQGVTGAALVLVETAFMANKKAMMEIHVKNLDNGFEGTIVRSATGEYKRGHRSADLLKVKEFLDEEFTIIGCKDGKGKEEGLAIWRCKLLVKGIFEEFSVRPKGTAEQRREWFDNQDEYIGKMLTVRFAYYTPYGIPFHPTGLVIRDYE